MNSLSSITIQQTLFPISSVQCANHLITQQLPGKTGSSYIHVKTPAEALGEHLLAPVLALVMKRISRFVSPFVRLFGNPFSALQADKKNPSSQQDKKNSLALRQTRALETSHEDFSVFARLSPQLNQMIFSQETYCGLSLLGMAATPQNPLGYLGAATQCLPLVEAAAVYNTNLVVNGGAETTPFTSNGWTEVIGSWGQETTCEIAGTASFRATSQPSTAVAELYQEIDVSDYATEIDERRQQFIFQGAMEVSRVSSAYLPAGRFIVEYRNSSGNVLDQYDSGIFRDFTTSSSLCADAVSNTFSDTRVAPTNTRAIRIRLITDKGDAANELGALHAWYDTLSLVADTPPPDPFPLPSLYNRNLVINGDGEKAPFSDFRWNAVGGDWEQEITCEIAGTASFRATSQPSSAVAELYQEIDVSDYATEIDERRQQFIFQGAMEVSRVSSAYLPAGRFIVEYRDSIGNILDQYDSGIFRDFTTSSSLCSAAVSNTFSDTRVAPTNTRTIRIRLVTDKGNAANELGALNAWYDTISLVADTPAAQPIPLPSPYNTNLIANSAPPPKAPFSDFNWVVQNGKWDLNGNAFEAIEQLGIQPAELYQDIDLSFYEERILNQTQAFDFSAWIDGTTSGAKGRVILEFLDSNQFPLNSYDTGESPSSSRVQYVHSQTAPIGTQSARVRLISDKKTAASPANVFFDSMTLVAQAPLVTPVPAPPVVLPPGPVVGVVSGFVEGENLFLLLDNGTTINAGSVIGPRGPQGFNGSIGPVGPIGPQGVQGPIGPEGLGGFTHASLSADGTQIILYYSNGTRIELDLSSSLASFATGQGEETSTAETLALLALALAGGTMIITGGLCYMVRRKPKQVGESQARIRRAGESEVQMTSSM